jgi:hypothetical protein
MRKSQLSSLRHTISVGVWIEGGGFTTYEAARLAGGRALADFLGQLELEEPRRD